MHPNEYMLAPVTILASPHEACQQLDRFLCLPEPEWDVPLLQLLCKGECSLLVQTCEVIVLGGVEVLHTEQHCRTAKQQAGHNMLLCTSLQSAVALMPLQQAHAQIDIR